ncbi:efflux RND transporter periplasmic adaptor subunit [Methylocystis sp. MJC1]|jgi:RND family efflux transporter MFP subunit|uniref:efflux RND transporter periplasmic adaptor subunit n=1 Tax=Methylocystis sp. MJC1 TaxID=2654282 RepID=UPI0013E9ABA1|nr:efflux RND transporter periplasmic adaptor subunit [Methylocystis sp. MJC1]KAF2991834.1 Nickel and cobalt resistance protein CnrB [Methylocystis sp. MJC1]MBU6528937.1 efflux RND transporter periplasmic adaptor subunit [Methylocystis sp. MJC1]UZX11820.1 efflux RND transporter periplasmic adaptor subunit [Methylocystis sp. MJC1]
MNRFRLAFLLAALASPSAAWAGETAVRLAPIDDMKAVVASVEPAHQLMARARIGGTVTTLKIKEGDTVAAGAEIALVADQKLFLQMQSLDQRIRAQQAQRDKAQSDFDRAQELLRRGTSTKVMFDQAKTALDVAERNLAALQSDRGVIEQQTAEGSVKAPGAGRILTIPVSVGRVVMPGETIATLAENNYILRLQLPERHARFMRAGDRVEIGERGVNTGAGARKEGRVRIVYPEIQGGRVIADVDVKGLDNYFVGERARVYVTTGKRDTILAPKSAVYRRAGVDFVRLADGAEVVVQTGDAHGETIEILTGLHDGDVVHTP